MYCVRCGVELADTESRCPLCGTVVYHPELQQKEGERLYPEKDRPQRGRSRWLPIVLSAVTLLAMLIVLLCNLQISGAVTWSGFVLGALILGYVIAVLPTWFSKPNPVIFVPCGFAATALYLLYISVITEGRWFLCFALPVTGGIGLIVTAVVTLLRYVKKGKLYIFGAASILLGIFVMVVEWLIHTVFYGGGMIGWSLYPLVVLAVLGGFLIFLAICRPARESMERKFFL